MINIRNILILGLFLLLFVNLIDYKDERYFQIFNILIYRDGVYLFVALATITSIMIAYSQWLYEINFQRKSDINGLLEELRHNVNIMGDLFVNYNPDEFYPALFNEIERMGENKIYPNPSDSKEREGQLFKLISFINVKVNFGLMPLRNNFIENAISSKNIFSLSNNRIFLNLGHLHYSINRHNYYIKNFNSDPNPEPNQKEFGMIKEEYARWLHFRLHFMLADLILNTKTDDFIDKEYINRIKKFKKN
ncbi:MAG: hypothetical protein MUO88_23515 [Desulfobacterales bacterium]|nr:hypothetical protein [Desulfobacterales bacterium]